MKEATAITGRALCVYASSPMSTMAGRRLLERMKNAGNQQECSALDSQLLLARKRYLQQSMLQSLLLQATRSSKTHSSVPFPSKSSAPDPGHLKLSDGKSYLLGLKTQRKSSTETEDDPLEGSDGWHRKSEVCANLFGGESEGDEEITTNANAICDENTPGNSYDINIIEKMADTRITSILTRCLAFIIHPGDTHHLEENGLAGQTSEGLVNRIRRMEQYISTNKKNAEELRMRSVKLRAELLKQLAKQRSTLTKLVRRYKLDQQVPRDVLTVEWLRKLFETFELKMKLERAVAVNRNYNLGTVPRLISKRKKLENELALLASKLGSVNEELDQYRSGGEKFRDVAERFKQVRARIAVVRDYLQRVEAGMELDFVAKESL